MEIEILPVLVRAFYLLVMLYFSFRFLKWLMKYAYEMKVINQIKGLPALPFIGNAHQLEPREKFLKQIVQVSRQYKDEPFFRLWIGCEHFIVFHKADHVDLLFSSSKNTQKSKFYEFLHPWLKTGLLTSYGDKWQNRRRLLTPSFHFEILNDFLLVMNDQADILVDILARECQKSKQIDIFAKMGKCALDIICETAMGQNVNAQHDQESVYVQAVNKITELIMQRQQNPAHWPDLIYNITSQGREHAKCLKILQDFTKQVIRERDAEFDAVSDSTNRKRAAFLDILLKAKRDDPTITDEDIQEEVDTFMFEGHDTTTAAASWACHLIGSHPNIQKKLHEEIDSVFGNSNRPLTNDDFKELKYLDCVIKETLRLFPSVPFFARSISQDEQIGNYRILKDGQAMVLAYMIHRDERYYPEPEKFDPDRFLPENCKDRHPYAYIPFSAGRRNCIGQRFAMMEEKVLIANMMRNFEIKSLKTTEELQPVLDLILRPINGLPVELKLRSK